jgi:lipoprotein NlpD
VRPPASAKTSKPVEKKSTTSEKVDTPAPTEPTKPEVVAEPGIRLSWPAKGKVTTEFNETNKGIDIAGKVGEPILAASDGKVVYAGNSLRGYGNLVIIKHDNTYLTAYAHNSKLLVKEGDSVRKGQRIAEMGDTDTNSPKLHFELRVNGKPVNPTPYLQ